MTDMKEHAVRKVFTVLVTCLMLGVSKGFADTGTDSGGVLQFSDFIKAVKVSGDLRLRYDAQYFRNDAPAKVDRERYRERLRVATAFTLPNDVFVKLRFASGSGEAISRNQTFGNLEQPKPFWIDQAFVSWSPAKSVTLMSGKMEMPLWWQKSSKAIWDDNVTPEGAAEQFKFAMGEQGKIFFNAMQMVANEVSGSTEDQYAFIEQLGTELPLPLDSKLQVAYAYHDWHHADETAFGETTIQDGNRRGTVKGVANTLLNPFGVSELTAAIGTKVAELPLSLQGTWLKNNRVKDKNPLTGASWEKKDTGYKTGFVLGKAAKANSWEASYFYQFLEADSTVASLNDSDFGPGGTNRKGHIISVAYNPTSWFTLSSTYHITKPIDRTLTTNGSVNRLFVDGIVKF